MRASGLPLTLVLLFAAGCAPALASPSAATSTQFVITATLQPTPTASAATIASKATLAPTAAPVEGMTSTQVYVRPQPAAAGNPLGMIAAATKVQIQAQDISGAWYEIAYAAGPGGIGWVASQYVDVKDKGLIQVEPATAAPTDVSPTATPAVAAALDQDSAEAPAVDVTFSPLGAGSILYSSDLSAPAGDGQDWIRFTPYRATVAISLVCNGNGAIETELTQNGARINDSSLPACGRTAVVSVSSGLSYTLRLFLSQAQGGPEYVRYELAIDGAP